jgi:hypothetical protein
MDDLRDSVDAYMEVHRAAAELVREAIDATDLDAAADICDLMSRLESDCPQLRAVRDAVSIK